MPPKRVAVQGSTLWRSISRQSVQPQTSLFFSAFNRCGQSGASAPSSHIIRIDE